MPSHPLPKRLRVEPNCGCGLTAIFEDQPDGQALETSSNMGDRFDGPEYRAAVRDALVSRYNAHDDLVKALSRAWSAIAQIKEALPQGTMTNQRSRLARAIRDAEEALRVALNPRR